MLDQLLQKVKSAIWNDDSNMYHPNSDRGGLIGQIENLFTHHQNQNNAHTAETDGRFGNVQPASQDRYGDPADRQFGNVKPASQDRYGDPADQERR